MQSFYDSLSFSEYLKQIGHDHNLTSQYELESFCDDHPELKVFFQDPDETIAHAPLFVIDEPTKKSPSYTATFTAHKFVKNQIAKTFVARVTFKSSIPYDNQTIVAFEKMIWIKFWKKYPNWTKDHLGYSTPDMKCKKK